MSGYNRFVQVSSGSVRLSGWVLLAQVLSR